MLFLDRNSGNVSECSLTHLIGFAHIYQSLWSLFQLCKFKLRGGEISIRTDKFVFMMALLVLVCINCVIFHRAL